MRVRSWIVLFGTMALVAGPARAHEEGDLPEPVCDSPPGPEPPRAPRADHTRIELLAHVDPDAVDRYGHVGGFNADVFAHRHHAYLGSEGRNNLVEVRPDGTLVYDDFFCPSRGVRAYDIFDPRHPTHVSTFGDAASEPEVTGTWTEKVIVQHVVTDSFVGELAVVSFQTCMGDNPQTFRGFGLYDVSDPSDPQRLSLVRTSGRGSHEIWLQPMNGAVYVWTAILRSEEGDGTTPGEPDFQIFDASDPEHPVRVGGWGAWAELGIRPDARLGTYAGNWVHSVVSADHGTLAVLSYLDLGTVLLDVSDPTDPIYLGRTIFPERSEGNAHSATVSSNGKLLIQTDEDGDPDTTDVADGGWGFPRFFDVSDPTQPVPLSTFKLPTTTQCPPPAAGGFTVHDPKIQGSRAYFSWFAEGIVVVDIADPRNPRFLAQFVPPPKRDPMGYIFPRFPTTNVWGVFLVGDVILASDVGSGLWVLEMK